MSTNEQNDLTENEIETPHDRPTSWRNNKTILWLVRIGFLLQFYIPAIVCCLFIYNFSTLPIYTMSPDDPRYDAVELEPGMLECLFFVLSVFTLPLVIVQCSIFTLILRFAKLKSAETVLWWLVVINVLHSALSMFIFFLIPGTLIRLTPPTILYLIAIRIESKANAIPNIGV